MADIDNPAYQAFFIRLVYLDYKLSGDGVTIKDAARRWDVSQKTVRRDLETIRQLGQALVEPTLGARDGHLYRYADKSQRVFAPEIHHKISSVVDFG